MVLGIVNVFTWTSEKLLPLPTLLRRIFAIFLSFVSSVVVFISCSVGFIELLQRFTAFMKRKANEYKDNDNIPLWYTIITSEYTGLILAYIIIPLHRVLLTASISSVLNTTTFFYILLRDILFVYIPTTVIRFVVKPKGLKSTSEIFICIVLSFLCSFGFYYVFNSIIYFPTIFDEISVHLVLSYKSTRKKNESKLANYSLLLFFAVLAILRRTIRRGEPILEAFTSSVIAFL